MMKHRHPPCSQQKRAPKRSALITGLPECVSEDTTSGLLAGQLAETFVELGHPTLVTHLTLLAGIHRMRGAGNIQVNQRISVAVFPDDGLGRGTGRANAEGLATGSVLKHHIFVGGMNVLLHE